MSDGRRHHPIKHVGLPLRAALRSPPASRFCRQSHTASDDVVVPGSPFSPVEFQSIAVPHRAFPAANKAGDRKATAGRVNSWKGVADSDAVQTEFLIPLKGDWIHVDVVDFGEYLNRPGRSSGNPSAHKEDARRPPDDRAMRSLSRGLAKAGSDIVTPAFCRTRGSPAASGARRSGFDVHRNDVGARLRQRPQDRDRMARSSGGRRAVFL